jgi:RHS repeat-associated protein
MNNSTRRTIFLVLFCLPLIFGVARPVQAGWGGWDEPAPDGYATILEGCTSWVWWGGPFITWYYSPPGVTCLYNPAYIHRAEIYPGCSEAGLVTDVYQPSGCRPTNAGPVQKELGHYCPLCGNPISLAGGNKFEEVTDFETATPDKLAFTRYYNSGFPAQQTTMLGYAWRTPFDSYIDTTNSTGTAGWVNIYRPDGQVIEMDYNSSKGWYVYTHNVDLTLTYASPNYTLTDSDDTVWTYTQISHSVAVLSSIRHRGGYTQTLQYNASNQLTSVTDSYGRTLQFTYQNGVVQTMTAPDGGVYTFLYQAPLSGSGNLLARVVKPGASPSSPPQSYLYQNSSFPMALTGIVDDDGNQYATFTYEQYGRPVTSQHAGGADSTTVAYNDTTNGRTVTNALGEQQNYQFSTVQQARVVSEISRIADGSTPAASYLYSYDSTGFLNGTTDWNGVATSWTNNSRGEPLTLTYAVGTPQARTVTYTWAANFRLPTQIVEPGRTTSFTYDANGNLLSKTATDTTTATTPYSTNGNTRVWSYTYSATGQRLTATDPDGNTTSYGYDASGTLVSVTNALGQATQVTSHDGAGRPLTTVDANGVATTLAYTPQGWLSSVAVAGAGGTETTTIAYDAAGQITQITRPDGSFLAYTHDAAHRLTQVSDAFGETITYTLDAMGDRTGTQIAASGGTIVKTQSAAFDDLGRLLQSIGAAGQTTGYAYDNNANVTGITDPLANATSRSFDALNRLIAVNAPLSSSASEGYDAHDNLTRVTDPRGLATTYVYDGLDNLIELSSPDTGVTVYHLDAAGNRTQQTDAAGNVVQMSYDALNRLTAKTYPNDPAENIAYAYDQPSGGYGIGRLTGVSDQSGSTAYVYDAFGNVVQETRVIGATTYNTFYAYDLANHVTQITYPSGRIASYSRDGMGRIASVTTQANAAALAVPVVSGATYLPFGPLTGLTYGNGLDLAVGFDQDYRPSAREVSGAAVVQSLAYGVDADGDITAISDAVTPARSQGFQYDALRRLIQASGVYGTLAYSYDAVGNRLSLSGGNNNLAESYGYAGASNQLLSVAYGGATRQMSYTAAGALASNDNGAGTVLSFAYNQQNRLAQVASNGIGLAQYQENFLGERVAKSTAAGITQFHYDRAGRLIAESDNLGNVLREHLWLEEMPVGYVAGGALYFVHPDHLGTPQRITDGGQNVVWDAAFAPFGWAAQLSAGVTENLRFPGQYADAETGLSYNFFRDYDPGVGRYVESDPIGLWGGVNPYGYVGGDPQTRTDPRGLSPILGLELCHLLGPCGRPRPPNACPVDPNALLPYYQQKPPPPLPNFDFNDPTKPPTNADGTPWDWHGPDAPGGDRGGWVNPDDPDQSLHPDLDHGPPIGPNWDFNDRNVPGNGWWVGPDGTVTPKP